MELPSFFGGGTASKISKKRRHPMKHFWVVTFPSRGGGEKWRFILDKVPDNGGVAWEGYSGPKRAIRGGL